MALGEHLAYHSVSKLDLIEGPVILRKSVTTGHGVETFVWPLRHPLHNTSTLPVLTRAHVTGEFRDV